MYCTNQDLADQASEQTLIHMTDDEALSPETLAEAGPEILSRLEKSIRDATDEINGYCQARYPVPFNPVPGIIRKLTVDIALYNLFSRRGYDEDSADKSIVDRYKAAIKTLENIAKGLVTLGTTNAPAPQASEVTAFSSNQRIFSRQKLHGM